MDQSMMSMYRAYLRGHAGDTTERGASFVNEIAHALGRVHAASTDRGLRSVDVVRGMVKQLLPAEPPTRCFVLTEGGRPLEVVHEPEEGPLAYRLVQTDSRHVAPLTMLVHANRYDVSVRIFAERAPTEAAVAAVFEYVAANPCC